MRKLWILWIVAALAASAWAKCITGSWGTTPRYCRWYFSQSGCPASSLVDDNNCSGPAAMVCDASFCYTGLKTTKGGCSWDYGAYRQDQNYSYTIRCGNQCEADSATAGGIILECQYDAIEGKWYKYTCTGGNSCADGACRRDYYNNESLCIAKYCEDYPTAEGCEQEKDTTLFACSDYGNGKSGLYSLSCRGLGSNIVSCNGKTDVNIEQDGQLLQELNGTCAANGYENGIQSGSTGNGSQTGPQQQNAECFAVLGSKCTMRDRNSGNTYMCDCDGSCDYAMRQLASGEGCANPYPQPQSSNDINLSSFNGAQSSSAGSAPSSAGSSATEGSSNSGGTSSGVEGGGNSSDFEYDYTDVLNDIRANTQYTGTQVNYLNDKAAQANDYLRQIAGKDWSPTINVAAPNVNVNVQGGDTARAGRDIYDWLTSAVVLDSSHLAAARQSGDSLYNSAVSFSDSVATLDVVDYSDSIGDAVQGVRGALATLRDTLDNSAISDSLERWQGLITDNGVISGAGSNSCPPVLTRQIVFTFPLIGDVQGGTLGRYLCTPVTGLSITLWALVRVLLRAGVAIACMWWLYRAVTGTETSGEDD